MGKQRAFKTEALTEMNWNLSRARAPIAGEQEWEFFCECGEKNCRESVFLTLDAYVALHDRGKVVLAGGHHLSSVVRARRLRGDAKALVAQAMHQVKRARRNLGAS